MFLSGTQSEIHAAVNVANVSIKPNYNVILTIKTTDIFRSGARSPGSPGCRSVPSRSPARQLPSHGPQQEGGQSDGDPRVPHQGGVCGGGCECG